MIEKGNIIVEKKIGIILVITNEKHNLEMLYASLSRQTYKKFSIYFVDNNSIDGSVEYSKKINKDFDFDINYIFLNENSGFAKGNNIGAKAATLDGCDYLFILNNDTELDRDCLNQLIKLAESDPQIGVVGPIFFYWTEDKLKNKIQIYGCRVNFKTQKSEFIAHREIFEDLVLQEKLEVDYVSGGTTFLKREVFQKIGLFEEKYFIYNDEIDFAYRVQQAGYKTYVTKNAKIWHNHNWSKKNKKRHYLMYYYMLRNRYLYFRKFRLYKYLVIDMVKEILFLPIKVRWAHRFVDIKLLKFYYQGIWDGLQNKSGKADGEFR